MDAAEARAIYKKKIAAIEREAKEQDEKILNDYIANEFNNDFKKCMKKIELAANDGQDQVRCELSNEKHFMNMVVKDYFAQALSDKDYRVYKYSNINIFRVHWANYEWRGFGKNIPTYVM